MRVLLIGHGCDPYRGSEPGVTWNWAWHLSEHHEVWVMTTPVCRGQIERFLETHPRPNLRFRYAGVPPAIDPDKPRYGIKGLQLSYILWLKGAFSEAQRLTSEMAFDIVHHVGWGTIAVASPFWKLGLPFIWGPLGGGQTVPSQFRYLFGSMPILQWMRDANIASMPFRPGFRRSVRHSSCVLAVNSDTAAVIRRAGANSDVERFLCCGIVPELLYGPSDDDRSREQMNILWGGTIEPRKALPLAIEAMARLSPSSRARLVIAGDGPSRMACQALCEKLGVSHRVEFLGSIPLRDMYALMARSDAFLQTSVRDTFPSITLEAAAHRLPIIALNHQGVADWLPDDAAIKVAVDDAESTIRSFAAAIATLEQHPDQRRRLGDAAYLFAYRNTWPERARRMSAIYLEAVARRRTPLNATPECNK